MKASALYLCYYHVEEALVKSQVIAYLAELAARGYRVHLLTFEKDSLAPAHRAAIRGQLASQGIRWHSLRYHARPSLPATLFDIAVGALAAAGLCVRHGLGILHARSHVPAAMALVVRALLPRRRFLFDLRGLLADEYADAGRWKAGTLKFRLTKRIERRFFESADGFVVLSHQIRKKLMSDLPSLAHRSDDIEVIPCCVDLRRFSERAGEREGYRRERGWGERRVLTYLGKLSPLYLPDEMVRFLAALRHLDARFFFQVLTPSDASTLRAALEGYGIPRDSYDVRFVAPAEVPRLLAGSDATISLRAGELSRRAASPTKVSESLAAGVPVVTNAGIGDCDEMLLGHRLGVVLSGFSDDDHRAAASQLLALLEDRSLVQRCRDYAERELSLERVGGPRYAAVYERLLALT